MFRLKTIKNHNTYRSSSILPIKSLPTNKPNTLAKNIKAQSAAEYVIVLLLAAVIVGATYDLFSRALGSFYNRLLSSRSGTTGMAP